MLVTLPEETAREIHSYRALLDAAKNGSNGVITISPSLYSLSSDEKDAFISAIAFLQLGFLPPIEGSSQDVKKALDNLVAVYKFSLKLVMQKLE